MGNRRHRARTKIRTHTVAPEPQARFFVQPPSNEQPHTKAADSLRGRKTIRSSASPFYDGLTEVRQAGSHTSRRVCKGLALNGSPHPFEVATDRRIRAQEDERELKEKALAKETRLLDQQLDAYLRRCQNATKE